MKLKLQNILLEDYEFKKRSVLAIVNEIEECLANVKSDNEEDFHKQISKDLYTKTQRIN